MAITGTFVADFSSFTTAVEQAAVSLRKIEENSTKVASSLSKMSDSFSGRRVIQDAIVMAEVFQRAGGAATFTAAELRRMGAVGEEAFEKLRKSGQPVPETLRAMVKSTRDFGAEAAGAVPHVGNLGASMRQFDGVLASLGLHVGPEIRAIGELGEAASSSALGLGGLTTAGFALGAGIGGWKIGRAIAELGDLDRIIGDTTAKMLGLGDVGGQGASARLDLLARASATAGREITSMSEAIFVSERALRLQREATAAATLEIEKHAEAVHKANLQNFTGAATEINNAAKLHTLEEDLAAAQKKRITDYLAGLDAKNAKVAETERALVLMGEAGKRAEQDAAAATQDTNKDLERQQALIDAIAKANRAMGGSFDVTRENFAQVTTGFGGDSGAVESFLRKGYSFSQALLYAKHPDYPPPENIGPRVPGFAGGVQNFSGGPAWVGERGPELLNLPRGSSVTPVMGGVVNVTNHVYVNGTAEEVARKVGAELIRIAKRGRLYGAP